MTDLEIIQEYGSDPYALFHKWFKDAEDKEPHDPEAACLATANKNGMPSARMVLIKEISEEGFRFHTNTQSGKGAELAENPQGALCFYWKSLRKQVRAEGKVVPINDQEADEYFASRRRGRQIGAWASDQSRNFETWNQLEQKITDTEQRFDCVDVIPRPEYWNGYRLVPHRIEFWIAHRDRLHTRFEYIRDGDNWNVRWMYP